MIRDIHEEVLSWFPEIQKIFRIYLNKALIRARKRILEI